MELIHLYDTADLLSSIIRALLVHSPLNLPIPLIYLSIPSVYVFVSCQLYWCSTAIDLFTRNCEFTKRNLTPSWRSNSQVGNHCTIPEISLSSHISKIRKFVGSCWIDTMTSRTFLNILEYSYAWQKMTRYQVGFKSLTSTVWNNWVAYRDIAMFRCRNGYYSTNHITPELIS